jgi:hypothetical protein
MDDDTHGIQREQVPTQGEGPDDIEEIRVYYRLDDEVVPMPSVSVVKALREDAEKKEILEGWRSHYDGKSKWARPWYEDQKTFKGHRGTLVHFAILDALGDASGDTYYHDVGPDDDNWGREEYYSEYCLKKWSKKAPSANCEDPDIRAPRENRYDGEHAWDRAVRGLKWATRAFKLAVMDGVERSPHFEWHGEGPPSEIGRLEPQHVLAVEEYVYNDVDGYAGQYDLLYEYPADEDGDFIPNATESDTEVTEWRTVLADIKTSSGVRFDHKLQSAAYKRAIETTSPPNHGRQIDECEIIRLYPDDEVVELSRSTEWARTLEGMEHEFLGLVDEAHNVTYTETLSRAEEQLRETRQSELTETEATTS